MTIAKKPNRNQNAISQQPDEKIAEAFINSAGKQSKEEKITQKRAKKIPVLTRYDPALLEKIDAAAEHRGMSRSSWIHFVISRALDQGEG